MLKFPKVFFQGEERDGFYIADTMKSAWAAELEVLQRIADLCQKHGLTYYVFFGTLLGAVRHKGFIPWDDDIDIVLKRKDYRKLLEVARTELPPEYRLLSIYTERDWHEITSRIVNSNAIDISDQRLREFHGCPFSVGVDIYPMDYIPDKEEKRSLQANMLQLIGQLDALIAAKQEREALGKRFVEYDKTIREGLTTLEKYYDMKFVRNDTLRNQLYRLYDKVCEIYGKETDRFITNFPSHLVSGGALTLKADWLEEPVVLDFENIKVSAPTNCDACLTARFGADYMTPCRERSLHDYPFYKEQKQILEERGLWEEAERRAKKIREEEEQC